MSLGMGSVWVITKSFDKSEIAIDNLLGSMIDVFSEPDDCTILVSVGSVTVDSKFFGGKGLNVVVNNETRAIMSVQPIGRGYIITGEGIGHKECHVDGKQSVKVEDGFYVATIHPVTGKEMSRLTFSASA